VVFLIRVDHKINMETTYYDKEKEVSRTVWTIPTVSRSMGLDVSSEEGDGCIPRGRPVAYRMKHKNLLGGKPDQYIILEFEWSISHSCFAMLFTILEGGKSIVEEFRVLVTLGMLDVNGELKVIKKTIVDVKLLATINASVPREVFLAAPDRLLPRGILTVCVEIKILPAATIVSDAIPSENLRQTMLDHFVDIGPSSVLLVFEDGEQRCHTFPLAARNGVWLKKKLGNVLFFLKSNYTKFSNMA